MSVGGPSWKPIQTHEICPIILFRLILFSVKGWEIIPRAIPGMSAKPPARDLPYQTKMEAVAELC